MMPYIIGKDKVTGEILAGNSTSDQFFLRGPQSEEKTIRDLVQLANLHAHMQPIGTNEVSRSYESPDEDKPLLPPWHKEE